MLIEGYSQFLCMAGIGTGADKATAFSVTELSAQAADGLGEQQQAHGLVSANARQLIPGEPIDNAPPTKSGRELHKMMRIKQHFPNHSCVRPQRVRL